MNPVKVLVIGAGGRGLGYSKYAKHFPHEMSVVGVAEPNPEKRESFKVEFGLKDDVCFSDWEQALKKEKFADAVIIATPDRMHFKPALLAMKQGYHILLEKPMSPSEEENRIIVEESKKINKVFSVCHVLRYTPYFRKIKKILDAGTIGDIVTVEHIEPVRYWHQAHSFIRGNWRNSDETSPMILQKSCHDMDIFVWLTGKKALKVSSFGSLKHFKPSNAPKGSSDRCLTCSIEPECPYSAVKQYIGKPESDWTVRVITNDVSIEGRLKALREGPYGRCVYHCDNNVVDHQVVALQMEDEITVSFTMTAFTNNYTDRRTRIMGTKGEIIGDSRFIDVHTFVDDFQDRIDTLVGGGDAGSGHGGGDFGLMYDFIRAVKKNDKNLVSSTPEMSLESHLMAFAAERSRVTGKTVDMKS